MGISYCIHAQTFSQVAQAEGINDSFGSSIFFGGGISFCDFDNDGDDDITFATPTGSDIYFYQNNNGTFVKIAPFVSNTSYTKQVLWADYDNDGDKDFFATAIDGVNRLYRNNGNQTFTDVTISAGILPINDPSVGATFGDYDNDGYLDLYILNTELTGTFTNYMYRNDGDGTFTNTTFSTGTGDGVRLHFTGFFFDYNLDGFQDIYVIADRVQFSNTLLKNNQDGTFSDVSVSTGTNIAIDAMNSGGADYDNDGDIDLYVTNTPGMGGGGNVMLRNEYPADNFSDATAATGTIFNRVGWGANFFDYDNDLDLDLYVSAFHNEAAKPNALYVNNGSGVFTEPLPNGFPGDTVLSLCNTVGDYNDDGMLDIAVSHYGNENFHLWKNESSNPNNYLKIRLEGTTSNKDGIGAMVEIYINGNKYIRSKHCGEGYMGQTSDKIHFGLGNSNVVDTLIVKWLGGNVDKFYNVGANQTFFAVEGNNAPLPLDLTHFSGDIINDEKVGLQWTTLSEIDFKGFEIQRSPNGLTYQNIGFQLGKGEQTTNQYSFLDENIPHAGRFYYRLKMMDNDGSFKYSNIVVLNIQPEELFSINLIYPNPVNELMRLQYFSKTNQNVRFKIVTSDGRIVRQWKEEILEDNGLINLDVKDIVQGNYFLIMEGQFSSKFSAFSIVR